MLVTLNSPKSPLKLMDEDKQRIEAFKEAKDMKGLALFWNKKVFL